MTSLTRIIFLYFIAMLFISCSDQNLNERDEINWDELSSVRFYDTSSLERARFGHYSLNDLENLNYSEADITEATNILNKSKSNNELEPLWKGTCTVLLIFKNGESKVLKVSSRGGLFYDFEKDKHYDFDDNSSNEWAEFVFKHRKILHDMRRSGT